MPQIYRQHSFDSRQFPDTDDSIVLSDLVRTGEASRLRRRGAMRIDHSPRPPSSSSAVFVPNADSMWATYPEATADEEYNPDSFPGEWIEMRDRQLDDAEYHQPFDHGYLLCCGGTESPQPSDPSHLQYYPSPLPSYPPVRPSYVPQRQTTKSNGCGAVVHINAIPRRRCGVWMAKEGGTDAIVEMDSSYFDRSAVTRMMKSTCGCVREGIGCAVCGNALGTRYKPCQAAAEGLFNTNRSPPNPLHPSGSKYWHCHQSSPHGSNFYVYTFFSDHVTSSPPHRFNTPPASPHPYIVPLSNPAALQSTLEVQSFPQGEDAENEPSTSRLPPRLPEEEYDMDGDLIVEEPSSPDKTNTEDTWLGR